MPVGSTAANAGQADGKHVLTQLHLLSLVRAARLKPPEVGVRDFVSVLERVSLPFGGPSCARFGHAGFPRSCRPPFSTEESANRAKAGGEWFHVAGRHVICLLRLRRWLFNLVVLVVRERHYVPVRLCGIGFCGSIFFAMPDDWRLPRPSGMNEAAEGGE